MSEQNVLFGSSIFEGSFDTKMVAEVCPQNIAAVWKEPQDKSLPDAALLVGSKKGSTLNSAAKAFSYHPDSTTVEGRFDVEVLPKTNAAVTEGSKDAPAAKGPHDAVPRTQLNAGAALFVPRQPVKKKATVGAAKESRKREPRAQGQAVQPGLISAGDRVHVGNHKKKPAVPKAGFGDVAATAPAVPATGAQNRKTPRRPRKKGFETQMQLGNALEGRAPAPEEVPQVASLRWGSTEGPPPPSALPVVEALDDGKTLDGYWRDANGEIGQIVGNRLRRSDEEEETELTICDDIIRMEMNGVVMVGLPSFELDEPFITWSTMETWWRVPESEALTTFEVHSF